MTTPRYPLATSTWDAAEIAAIQSVVDTGYYTMGAKVRAFEEAFAAYVGAKYCVMSNSGSSANLLMIAALRFRKDKPLLPGDEVIVPAVSWSTTYYPVTQYGLSLRFVDIDRHTLNMDPEALVKAITPKTRAILAVNLLGNPNDFEVIRKATAGRDIILLEDNCESLGATFRGKQAGSFGLMGSFSSFFSHHIATMEGGLTVTDDEELYHLLLSLRSHGWTRHLPKHNHVTGTKSDDEFEESFRFVLPGYNLRPVEMSGAIGIEQLKKLPAMVEARRANAKRFLDVVADVPWLHPQREIGESSWFGFSMVLTPGAPLKRADMVRAFREAGIECRPIVAGNFAKNDVLRYCDHSIAGELTNAEWIDHSGLFVGNHHYDLSAELAHLGATLQHLS